MEGKGRRGLRAGVGICSGAELLWLLGFVRTHGCGGILSSFLIKEEREKRNPAPLSFRISHHLFWLKIDGRKWLEK